jgi:hypothetical protein
MAKDILTNGVGTPIIIYMTPKDLEEHFGSKPEIARALGVSLPSVYDWFNAGEVPEGRQYQVELATNGALRASKPALRQQTQEAA